MHNVTANGAAMPALGMGTWTLKGDEAARLVCRAVDVGYRHIDTAAAYGNEEAVGEGIRDSDVGRDELFVTTKVWFTDIAGGDLERSVEASLRRLSLDRVDLVLIHWPNPQIPLAQSIAALCRTRNAGLTRHIGVSNFTTALLDEAVSRSSEPLVCNQVEYHPHLDQDKVLAVCRRHGMALVSYCPLGRGGAILEEAPIRAAAQAHGRTPAQVVLRWHVQQQGVAAIPRTSRAERLAENFDISGFELNGDEMAAISALRSRNHRICDMEFGPDWDA